MLARFINKLRRSEAGATAIEYGLIAALIAVALIGALETLEDSLTATFGDVEAKLTTASSP